METYQKAFGLRIRQLRDQRGFTQEHLAHEAKIHVTYLSGIERGVRNPSLRSIRALAKALGVRVGKLFAFESCQPPQST